MGAVVDMAFKFITNFMFRKTQEVLLICFCCFYKAKYTEGNKQNRLFYSKPKMGIQLADEN